MRLTSSLTVGAVTTDVTVSAATDIGSIRPVNEDSFLATPTVFLVADGMGGHNAGDQASGTVRTTFADAFAAGVPTTAGAVLDAIAASNTTVRSTILDEDGARLLSGTTLAGVAVVESDAGLQWMAFNIGDSRIYEWDGRALAQLSVDHSAVQELVEQGLITVDQAAVHPDRNIITRAIGATETVDADVWLIPIVGTQCFLLCSDGLTKEIDDGAISRILAEHESTNIDVAEALVAAAVAAGGADNVTAVVVEARSRDGRGAVEHSSERELAEYAGLEDTRPRIS